MVQSARNGDNDGCMAFVLCLVECLLRCLEDALEYFNKFAYIYVGMYGYSYIEAGKNVMTLFGAKGECCYRFDVAVAVHPHINIRKLVEILQRVLQTPEQTLHKTQYKRHAAIVVPILRALHHGPDRLNDGHQERPKADTAKGGGGGTNKGVLDGGGAAGGGVNGGEPPGGDHAGNSDVDGVLEAGGGQQEKVRERYMVTKQRSTICVIRCVRLSANKVPDISPSGLAVTGC